MPEFKLFDWIFGTSVGATLVLGALQFLMQQRSAWRRKNPDNAGQLVETNAGSQNTMEV